MVCWHAVLPAVLNPRIQRGCPRFELWLQSLSDCFALILLTVLTPASPGAPCSTLSTRSSPLRQSTSLYSSVPRLDRIFREATILAPLPCCECMISFLFSSLFFVSDVKPNTKFFSLLFLKKVVWNLPLSEFSLVCFPPCVVIIPCLFHVFLIFEGRDIHSRVLRSEKGCKIRVTQDHTRYDCVHTREDTVRLDYASRFVRVIYSSHIVSIKLGTVTILVGKNYPWTKKLVFLILTSFCF